MSKAITEVSKILDISTDTGKGYRALTNLGEHGGQEVPHLHFHLFGGEKNNSTDEIEPKFLLNQKFSNPLKSIYYNLILRENLKTSK